MTRAVSPASPSGWAADDSAAVADAVAHAVEEAAQLLANGDLVAFPTETVYGLGARADDAAAVAKVYSAKGRPVEHPLIVHVFDAAAARPFAVDIPAAAERLIAAFWPGPLTIIVPRAPGIAEAAAGGQNSIGLRAPAHPLARELLGAAQRLGVPGIAAPSANRFGRLSPTCAAHVRAEFGAELPLLDGGPCAVGIESCIVDLSRGGAVLLRPGSLGRAQLEAAAGVPLRDRDAEAPRASGTLAAHYAPRARLRLMPATMLRTALDVLGAPALGRPKLAVYSRTVAAAPGLPARSMPATAAGVAHDLFAALHELDALGVDLIWVEAPPETTEWDGVRDRLERAAAA